jgi:hypothetical protein
MASALATAAARLTVARIDRVWLFPPWHHETGETGVAVFGLFPASAGADPLRRDIVTLRYLSEVAGLETTIEAEGSAPLGSMPGVISGVLRRLGEAAEGPAVFVIGGDAATWEGLLRATPSAA